MDKKKAIDLNRLILSHFSTSIYDNSIYDITENLELIRALNKHCRHVGLAFVSVTQKTLSNQ